MADPQIYVVDNLRGGRSGEPSHSLAANQCAEAYNVDTFASMLCQKRGGADSVTISGGTAFSLGIYHLFKHVGDGDERYAELWAIDGAGVMKRMALGTTFADVTQTVQINTGPVYCSAVSFNGKFFMAYLPASLSADGIYVYDPYLASPLVRRVGFKKPVAPTAADNGSGSYAATKRYYRVRWVEKDSATSLRVIRQSEPGPSLSITPSGSGTGIRVTKPTGSGTGETHWKVEVSLDNATFYLLSTIVVGTTTYDDTAVTSTYSSNEVSPDLGEYETFPYYARCLVTDGSRLLAAGVPTEIATGGALPARVWFTSPLGSTDEGDDERVAMSTVHQNFIDIGGRGAYITGMAGPIDGTIYVFKYREVWKLIPTGDDVQPYLAKLVTDSAGAIWDKSIVSARDQFGNPAIYFMAANGPHRIVSAGNGDVVQFLGTDINDIWVGNVSLSPPALIFHSVHYAAKHQVWFWLATSDGDGYPSVYKLVLDYQQCQYVDGDRVRGGWYVHTGGSAAARCSVMFSNTPGSTMSGDLKPYMGRQDNKIFKCDTTSGTDNGVGYGAYVKTRPVPIAPFGAKIGAGPPSILATPLAATSVGVIAIPNYRAGTANNVSIAPVSPELITDEMVIRKLDAVDVSDASTLQYVIGDPAGTTTTLWKIHGFQAPIWPQEYR